jgi:hypothetical protein
MVQQKINLEEIIAYYEENDISEINNKKHLIPKETVKEIILDFAWELLLATAENAKTRTNDDSTGIIVDKETIYTMINSIKK